MPVINPFNQTEANMPSVKEVSKENRMQIV